MNNPQADAGKPRDELVRNAVVDEKYWTDSGELEPAVSKLHSPLTPHGLLRRLKEVRAKQFLNSVICLWLSILTSSPTATPCLLQARSATSRVSGLLRIWAFLCVGAIAEFLGQIHPRPS